MNAPLANERLPLRRAVVPPAVPSPGGESVYFNKLKADFKAFLAPTKDGTRSIESSTIITHDYSHIAARPSDKSGIWLYNYARLHDDRYSQLIRAENKMVVDACNDFSKLSFLHLPYDSLGPGTNDAVLVKDTEIVRALGSRTANILDVEEPTAFMASLQLKIAINSGQKLQTRPVALDFTKKWPDHLRHNKPRFATMLGGTMGQMNMPEFFRHFHEMTDGNAAFFFVLNGKRSDPVEAYSGQHFKRFKSNIWNLLRMAANDSTFNTQAIEYTPDFDGERVRHRYFVTEDTSVTIDGDLFPLPGNTKLITGYSARPTVDQVAKAAEGTGLELAKLYTDPITETHGFLMRGDKFRYALT